MKTKAQLKNHQTKTSSKTQQAKASRASGATVRVGGADDGAHATFADLCKELGKRVNSTENALLCYRAYRAYVRENPDTAHGKANKLDRDPTTRSFRHAAAKESGVAVATIDALLQVGKAVEPLPTKVKEDLASSSLSNSMRTLRKLATAEFDADREQLISNFIKEEQADPPSAKASLKKKLGMAPVARDGVESKMVVEPESHELAAGEHLDVKAGHYIFRVEVGGQAAGRVHVTVMAFTGEHKPAPSFLARVEDAAASDESSSGIVEATTEAA